MDTNNTNIKTDEELIEEFIKTGDKDSFNILLDRHAGICCSISQKYLPSLEKRGISSQEVTSEKHYILYKSIISYNKNKETKFSTWLANHVRYHWLTTLNKTKPIALLEEKELIHCADNQPVHENYEFFDNIMIVLDKLNDERIKKIIMSRFLSGPKKKSWKKVAVELGISNQQCINLFERAKKLIRAKLNNVKMIEEV